MIGLTLIYYFILASLRLFSLSFLLSLSLMHTDVSPTLSYFRSYRSRTRSRDFSPSASSRRFVKVYFSFTLNRSRRTAGNLRDEACFEGNCSFFFLQRAFIVKFMLILNRCSLIRALDKRFYSLPSPTVLIQLYPHSSLLDDCTLRMINYDQLRRTFEPANGTR